jgi:Protein of unknown function (DUF3631)/CHC2 zinc finger
MHGIGQFEDWVRRARSVPIEREIDRRGIKLTRQGNAEFVGPCPKCGGDDRFSINTKKQVFNCRGCGAGGDVIELVEHLDGVDFVAACTTLTGQSPPQANSKDHAGKPEKIVAAEYPYHDEGGNVLFVVERVEFRNSDGSYVLNDEGKRKKTFRQKRPDPDRPDKWIFNIDGVPVVPYRLPELIEAIANERQIFIVEGEAKVDLLFSWNVAATCCAGGSKKWKPEHSNFLHGTDVVTLPDNDSPGWEHVNLVGAALSKVAKRVRVLVLPNLQPKGDVIDWAKSGGTREQLDALLNDARDWEPPTTDSLNKQTAAAKAREDELLEALAKLPPGIELHRQRRSVGKELGVPDKAIDAELKARREKAIPLYGHWIVEPWPELVDGDSLLGDIILHLRRHIVCTHDDALAIALWIMLAWVHDEVATHSPILDINSAEPESGKSTTLGLISFLAPRCLPSVDISEAALFRSIELWAPSFAIDEFDTVLASDEKAALRSIINSGHTRGQGVVRCVEPDFRPQHFKTFCPKAIGMVGRKLPPSTLSRCIIVELRRRKKDERIEKFEHKDDNELANLRSRLLRWSIDNVEALRAAKPSMPENFDNRRADNWRIQLAIADLAGGDWGDQARLAAAGLECASDTRTAGGRLLAALKLIFDQIEAGEDAIGSEELVNKLTADTSSEWAEWRAGKPISQRQLASLLKPYRIFPEQVRIGPRQVRGYVRSRFADVWERYL